MDTFKEKILRPIVQFLIRDVPSIVLSLALFLGGIWLLALRIPGWSLLFGLIFTPMGGAFIVFTLDRVARNKVVPPRFQLKKCKVCGRRTYALEKEKEVICARCEKDISQGILKERAK